MSKNPQAVPVSSKLCVCLLALAQLVAEARPDWDRDEFDGIVHSLLRPLPEPERPAAFASLLVRTARLLGIDDSAAADLRHETRSPVEKPVPAGEDVTDRGAALARSLLAGSLIAADVAKDGGAA